MSKKIQDGVWVVVCDWQDPQSQEGCTLGYGGEPAMFVDPEGGRNPEFHFQCGQHHGIIKQEDKEEFQLPPEHKLDENTLKPQGNHTAEKVGVVLEGFKPDPNGRVWNGSKVDIHGRGK